MKLNTECVSIYIQNTKIELKLKIEIATKEKKLFRNLNFPFKNSICTPFKYSIMYVCIDGKNSVLKKHYKFQQKCFIVL